MSIFKDTFKPEIQKQLNARQKALVDRGPTTIQYFNARNAWIRMTSAVDTYVGPVPASQADLANPKYYNNELAAKHVLQGGTLFSSIDGLVPRTGVGIEAQAYSLTTPGRNVNNRLGIRPMPGITGIDVKSKSAYGSLREVTVNFIAWDIRQLEDLELLYMRPGYTVLVEWGWAPYLFADEAENKTLRNAITYYDILNKTPDKETIFKDLYDNAVKEYQGNYDAMFGYIKNYSWSARNDGGYDCTTTIISLGEVMESLKVNYAPFNDISNIDSNGGLLAPKIEGMTKSDLPDLKKIYSKNVLAGLFYELYTIGMKKMEGTKDEGKNFTIVDNKNGTPSYYDLFKKTINVSGGPADANSDGKIGASDEQIYITLEGLCSIINNYVTFKDSKGNKSFVSCSVMEREYLDPLPPDPLTGDGYLLCLAHPLQLSVDPTICVIKSPLWVSGFKVNPDTILPNSTTNPNLITFPSKLNDNKLNSVLDQLFYISIPTKTIKNKQAVVDYLKRVTQQDPNTVKELTRKYYQKLKDPNYKVVRPTNTDLISQAIDEGSNIDNTKLNKSLSASGVGSSTSLFTFLQRNFLTNLSTSQVQEAFGSATDSTKTDPVAEQQRELNNEKQKLESIQSTAIKNIQYLNNIQRPYFYQNDWKTELGIIGNIYVNLNYLYRLALDNNLEATDTKEKKDINLYNFLKSVLSEISAATGNVNNFDLYIDPISNNRIYIIDVNYVDSKKRNEVYENLFQLEIQNLKSTARSYKLESQIFPDQSTTVAIGAQVGGGALATDNNTMLSFNKGVLDRIIPKKVDPTIDPNQPDVDKIKSQIQNVNDALQSLYEFFGDQSYGIFTDADFDTEKSSDYKNSLKDLINFFKNLTKSDIKNRAIIPTKFTATIDGIGGLVIGHMFKINPDLLPRGYKGEELGSKLGYTVTGIGHSIKDNDWTTDIESQTIILDEPEGTISFEELIVIKKDGTLTTEDKEKINNKIKNTVKRTNNSAAVNAIVSKYGEVGDTSQIVTLTLPYTMFYDNTPVKSVKVHKLAKDSLEKILKEVLTTFGLDKIKKLKLDQFSGIYNIRDKRGAPGNPSIHSWAIAIDIYAAENGLNQKTGDALFSKPEYKPFIDIWYKYGWKSFGRELGYDWMHFQVNDVPF